MLNLHTDNKPIKSLSLCDQSRLYIGLLWPHRNRYPSARNVIRSHVSNIRRWSNA